MTHIIHTNAQVLALILHDILQIRNIINIINVKAIHQVLNMNHRANQVHYLAIPSSSKCDKPYNCIACILLSPTGLINPTGPSMMIKNIKPNI